METEKVVSSETRLDELKRAVPDASIGLGRSKELGAAEDSACSLLAEYYRAKEEEQ